MHYPVFNKISNQGEVNLRNAKTGLTLMGRRCGRVPASVYVCGIVEVRQLLSLPFQVVLDTLSLDEFFGGGDGWREQDVVHHVHVSLGPEVLTLVVELSAVEVGAVPSPEGVGWTGNCGLHGAALSDLRRIRQKHHHHRDVVLRVVLFGERH